jgi:DNA/RNA endonuclease YhcR with UshA esterase domain
VNLVTPLFLSRGARRASLLAAGTLVLAIAACDIDPDQAEPTTIAGTGTVAGQLYNDVNLNGTFDPLNGDTAIVGATVELARRGDSASIIRTTTTGANGSYSFTDVPVGSHEIRARMTSASIRTCAPLGVNVAVGESVYNVTGLRPSCRINIREARAGTTGTLYTVQGTITVPPGVLTAGNGLASSEVWVQDTSGGIALFQSTSNYPAGLQLGDIVEVTGPLGANAGQLQLSPNPIVVKRGSGPQVTPRDVTGAQLLARTYDGQLVRLPAFTVTSVGTVSATSGGYNVNGTAASGEAIQLRINSSTVGIPASKWVVGQTFSVTGIASIFGSTVQIKPRGLSDIVP